MANLKRTFFRGVVVLLFILGTGLFFHSLTFHTVSNLTLRTNEATTSTNQLPAKEENLTSTGAHENEIYTRLLDKNEHEEDGNMTVKHEEEPGTTRRNSGNMHKFLPNYKNPCWFQGDQTAENLRCIPYFHMPGAAKSGSTTLCDCMNYHPEIALPKTKEVGFWNRGKKDYDKVTKIYPNNFVRASLDIFKSTKSSDDFEDFHHKVTYDCTPRNVWFHWLPEVLSDINKETRVIIIMRHPTDRAFSSYHHGCVKRSKEGRCPPEAFDKTAREATKAFQECTNKTSVSECVKTAKGVIAHSVYIGYVKHWLEHIPRSQVLFIKAEEMYNNTVDVMDGAFDFLGFAPADDETRDKIRFCMNNRIYPGMVRTKLKLPVSKIPGSQSDVKLSEKARKQWSKYRDTILPETRKLLDDFYAPFNKMLAEYLGDDRFLFERSS